MAKKVLAMLFGMRDKMSEAAFLRICRASSGEGGGGAAGPSVLFGKRVIRTCSRRGGNSDGENTRVEIVWWRNLENNLSVKSEGLRNSFSRTRQKGIAKNSQRESKLWQSHSNSVKATPLEQSYLRRAIEQKCSYAHAAIRAGDDRRRSSSRPSKMSIMSSIAAQLAPSLPIGPKHSQSRAGHPT